MVSIYPIILPMMPLTHMTPYIYPMGHHSYSFFDQKWEKNVEKHVFAKFLTPSLPILPITSFHRPMKGLQLLYDITHGTLYTHEPI
jgi:hypothetical protein